MRTPADAQTELEYCQGAVADRGNCDIGSRPAGIAEYLRIQSWSAFNLGCDAIAARLATAAFYISTTEGNQHPPNWAAAERALRGERTGRGN